MKTLVEFRSDEFPPYEGEEDEVNPGRYGKRVAEFLVQGLKERGFEPLEPVAEDWGWIVPIRNDSFKLWIGCGNLDEYPGGFRCFIEPHQPAVRRFPFLWKVDTSATVAALQAAIDQTLTASTSVRDKRWSSYEEFNRPARPTDG